MSSWYSWDNITHIKTLCNVVQDVLDNIASEKSGNVVLKLLGQDCTEKILCNIVPEAPNNIAQDKIKTMLF